MDDSQSFFPDVFDQKKKAQKDPGGNGCGCVSERKIQHRSQGKKMNGFYTRFFQLSWGRGQECVFWCATCTHRAQQHRLCFLTNTDHSHEHRIHGLGIRLIWVPKAFLQINHNKLLCFSVFPAGIWFIFSKGLTEFLLQQL